MRRKKKQPASPCQHMMVFESEADARLAGESPPLWYLKSKVWACTGEHPGKWHMAWVRIDADRKD